ncbi:MAG: hypothetical protein Kow001_09710 [Acidobacteriota bacterium]
MDPTVFSMDHAVAILARTPPTVRALLDGLPEPWVQATEGEGTWSPHDVVGHLVHAERTNWIPRLFHLLQGSAEPFPPFDREGQFAFSRTQTLSELLDEFAALRRDSLETLAHLKLTAQDLSRTGLHPELGKVRVDQLLATWVVHDLDHVAQVVRTMAKVYAGAVGPWSAYLSILR